MIKKLIVGLLMVLMVMGYSIQAQADLINRGTDTLGNRLIYDDDRGITWYDFSRQKDTWINQAAWAQLLTVTHNSTIYQDWRLPTTPGTTFGGTNEGEMGHLYYDELGKVQGGPLGETDPFQDLQASDYWFGTVYSTGTAWKFDFELGGQDVESMTQRLNYGMAVRSGDVSAVINDSLNLDSVVTSYDSADCGGTFYGTFTISATFSNTSSDNLSGLFFAVDTLTGGNVLCNADGDPGGEGSMLSVPPADLGSDNVLTPGESFTQDFDIGLASFSPFQFFVDAYGEVSP